MPPGYNNPDHLKGRKKRSSGWFITINSNKPFSKLGEDGVQKFKKAIQELFNNPDELAKIIEFKIYRGAFKQELEMPKAEAVKKFIQFPVAMEGVIERTGRNNVPLIHAHIIVGMFHWSNIHLNAKAAAEYFKEKIGYPVRFQLGGDESTPRVYRQIPSPEEVRTAMNYAGKDLRKDGDYFNGTREFSIAEYEARYGALEPGDQDLEIES